MRRHTRSATNVNTSRTLFVDDQADGSGSGDEDEPLTDRMSRLEMAAALAVDGEGFLDNGSEVEEEDEEDALVEALRADAPEESDDSEDEGPARKTSSAPKARRLPNWKRVGVVNGEGLSLRHVGFYHSHSRQNLDVRWWAPGNAWYQEIFVDYSMGREKGDDEEWIHHQSHGNVWVMDVKAGLDALSKSYKEKLMVPVNEGHKVQFKWPWLVMEQTDDKMCAYTRKDKQFSWFLWEGRDANGDQLTDEYLDYVDDKFKVPRVIIFQ